MSVEHPLQAVRLAVELGAVVSVTAWGFQAASGPTRWLLAVGCAAALLTVWGRYVAPTSPSRLHDPARLLIEIVLFVVVGAAIAGVVGPAAGATFAAFAVVDALALRAAGSRRTDATHR